MVAPSPVTDLVARYDRNRDSYLAGGINEMQLRLEFINPFFSCLGWDIENKQGYAPAYREVIFEDSLKVGGETKAPDYCFRIGGMRKFFVEAKKPAVNIATDVAPAFQLRRYAWSAKLPLSILTDFEEFAVYDCRVRPTKTDKPSIGRIKFLEFKDYLDRWTELYDTFSRDAVVKGSFDKFVEENRAKKGTTEVDDAFLSEIERWRDLLARNIALRNPSLTTRELNFAVQRTIDRIIFLRICEDRAIETYGQLMALLNGERVYPRLKEVFHRADERYNSGLFHFRPEKNRPENPDELSLKLLIDDKVLKDIIANLYYPDSPYEFSVFSPEILGQVYEQFLGKVIRLTAGHQAKVEDKPEVRKAGGVYYTPTYIVDYIVKNTVGKLLEGSSPQPSPQRGEGEDSLSLERERARVRVTPLTPKDAAKLRILDPACGSGSFLLGAYQYLLNWHRDWYVKDGPEKHTKELFPAQGGDWRLTTAKKKEILLNNIYGVDIDQQAVEVTKLSLLLKVLEGENEQTIQSQLKLFQERALPDLGDNIKCGNSLIGPDFYQGEQQSLFDDEEQRLKVNAFDWQAEFPDIMKAGGFDVLLGNPPYGATFGNDEVGYIRRRFAGASKSYDSYELFLAQSERLLGDGGRLSMIIPASWLTGDKYAESRKLLNQALAPRAAYVMPFDVFEGAYIDTAVVVLERSTRPGSCLVHYFPKRGRLGLIPEGIGSAVPVAAIRDDDLSRLTILLSKESSPILKKLREMPLSFGDWFDIQRGVQPYSRSLHSEEQIAKRFLHADSQRTREYIPELQGSELARYSIAPKRASYIKYCDDIASSRPMRMFQGRRIVLRRLLTRKFRLQASLAVKTMITTDNVLNAVPKSQDANVAYALAVMNSRLVSWYYVNTSMIAQKDDFPQVHISALAKLQIPISSLAQQVHLAKLAERMIELNQQLRAVRSAPDKTAIERQIAATDKQIDQLVYELCGLTEEEIRIVEGELK